MSFSVTNCLGLISGRSAVVALEVPAGQWPIFLLLGVDGLEDVEAIGRRRANNAWCLLVEVQLLHVALPLPNIRTLEVAGVCVDMCVEMWVEMCSDMCVHLSRCPAKDLDAQGGGVGG